MSRRINLNAPLSEADKQYLLTRANGRHLIEINERQFAGFDEKQKEKARVTAQRDEEEEAREAALYAEDDSDDEDGYHPEDIAQVADLTTAQLRQLLSKLGLRTTVSAKEQKIEGSDDTLSEKEVLAYRVLDHLDEKRRKG